ncbi:hypothetical protein EMIT0158MI4_180048 [Burkholderia ambifaria]
MQADLFGLAGKQWTDVAAVLPAPSGWVTGVHADTARLM